MRNNLLFGLIITLSILLRLFILEKIPNGLYSDEAAYGYNAYSVLMTGKDEYGASWPLAFKSFGDYKAPLYIYLMMPFIRFFGLTVYGVRIESAYLSVLAVIIVYFLVRRLYSSTPLAHLSSFFVSVMPLSLQFGRMAHENNLTLFLITLGILSFFLSVKFSNLIYISFITFAASIYAYHDARVLTPLLIICLLILYKSHVFKIRKKVILSMVIFLILISPFLVQVFNPEVWTRPRYTIFTSDPGIVLDTNQERGEDKVNNFSVPLFFHNKVWSTANRFFSNYFSQLSFQFLFLSGDEVKIYKTIGSGILYIATAPFLLLGLYLTIKNKAEHNKIILIWLLISPLPAALTRFVPSASRMISFLPVSSLIIAFGMFGSLRYFKSLPSRKVFIVLVSLIFTLEISKYLHNYYFNTPVRYAKEWHYGMDQVVSKVKSLENRYDKIWFSKNAWGYIYPLFYLPYPPEKYQKQSLLGSLNEFGFGWVNNFDKFIFGDFPVDLISRRDVLFIGAPSNFHKDTRPLDTIYYPDGQPAFYFADHESFQDIQL